RSCKSAAKRPAAAAASVIAADAATAAYEFAADTASSDNAVLAAKRNKKDADKEDETEGMACYKCSHAVKTVNAYFSHMKRTHNVAHAEVGAWFKCMECGHITRSKYHEQKCSGARFTLFSGEFEKKEDKTDWMKCHKCSHLSKNLAGFISHLRDKHKLTPTEVGISFKCTVCGHTCR
ncbi:hypothetical protein PFISCL1PPCAC_22299, partial [Pristionchus fissidentatus]